MNEIEQKIWATAFANAFEEDRILFYEGGRPLADISGFACAEIADVAVEKYREAVTGPDAEYLLIVKEGLPK